MGDQVKEILNKIPYLMVIVTYGLWMGYKTYLFKTDTSSPLVRKQAEISGKKNDIKTQEAKKKDLNTFEKNLDVKREELRALAVRLNETKASLNEDLDVPALIKTVITEAKKIGLRVEGLRPSGEEQKEFYVESRFKLPFRGVYAQLVVFLDRISRVNKILRVDSFRLKPSGNQRSRYVEVEGELTLKAFRYAGSKADEIAAKSEEKKAGS